MSKHTRTRQQKQAPGPQPASDYGAVPFKMNRRILESDLCPTAKVLLLMMVDHAGHGQSLCMVSGEKLAEKLGITPRYVNRLTRELEADGWIRVVRLGGTNLSRREIYVGPTCFGDDAPGTPVPGINEQVNAKTCDAPRTTVPVHPELEFPAPGTTVPAERLLNGSSERLLDSKGPTGLCARANVIAPVEDSREPAPHLPLKTESGEFSEVSRLMKQAASLAEDLEDRWDCNGRQLAGPLLRRGWPQDKIFQAILVAKKRGLGPDKVFDILHRWDERGLIAQETIPLEAQRELPPPPEPEEAEPEIWEPLEAEDIREVTRPDVPAKPVPPRPETSAVEPTPLPAPEPDYAWLRSIEESDSLEAEPEDTSVLDSLAAECEEHWPSCDGWAVVQPLLRMHQPEMIALAIDNASRQRKGVHALGGILHEWRATGGPSRSSSRYRMAVPA